ncbi:unnamed protein product [Coregonus sp. 'balchen']|nr:unnamed protein product [Coregonus sp. 'balchen']
MFGIFPALGFGVDPALRINVFDELKLGESFAGVFQVQGFHNESRAFLLQDSWRNVRVKEDVAEVMLQKLRDRTEFTVLATLKQERLNSGVLLSIHHAEHRDTIENPGSSPVRGTIENPGSSPVRDKIEEPGSNPVRDKIEDPRSSPVRGTIENPGSSPVRDKIEDPGSNPVRDKIEDPGSSPVRDKIEDPGSSPVRDKDTIEDPGSSPVRDTIEDPGSSPVRGTIEDPGSSPVRDKIEDPGSSPVRDKIEALVQAQSETRPDWQTAGRQGEREGSRLWYLELESSGQRNEIRLHYRTRDQREHTEVFPYSLADDRWHKLSVAVSVSHVVLHVDCNRIYERCSNDVAGLNLAHQLLVIPMSACPTCNDFHGLVQKIMELQDVLAKTSSKLSRAEEKMQALDGCYCERTCSMNGVLYREDEGWTDGCRNCSCYLTTPLPLNPGKPAPRPPGPPARPPPGPRPHATPTPGPRDKNPAPPGHHARAARETRRAPRGARARAARRPPPQKTPGGRGKPKTPQGKTSPPLPLLTPKGSAACGGWRTPPVLN